MLRLLALTTLTLLGLASARAQQPAEVVRVAPAPSGFLSVFRVVAVHRRPADAAPDTVDCEQCSAYSAASELIDLREIAGPHRDHVDLGMRLHAPRDARQRWLLGTRGTVEVWLDGERLHTWVGHHLREDQFLIDMRLAAGDHHLAFRCSAPERGGWGMRLRAVDGRYRPGVGFVVADVGPLSTQAAQALARDSVAIEEKHILSDEGPVARLVLGHPGGGPRMGASVLLGEQSIALRPERGIFKAPVVRDVPIPRRGGLPVRALVEGERRRLGAELALDRPLLQAMAAIRETDIPDASKGPMQWRFEEMRRCVEEHESDREWRQLLVRESNRLVRSIRDSNDPFASPRGYQRMGHISSLDGSAQPYELFVPPRYRGRRAWPLVVTLHGFKGNAGDYFRNTFGLPRDYETNESLVHHGRHGAAPEDAPMIVIAPQGRGQTMYRHAGEIDILEAIADVRERFRIDERRIYITGGSMGGTGAAYLPFRHPDMFAAAAALAGYHDQRVRQDTHHEGLSESERFIQAMRSDIDWTENALYLPMLLVRGTRDRPLDWTRRQVARLRELGYDHEHREPELGHNVWTDTYVDGAIFELFDAHRRPQNPRRVRLRTARERTHSAYWVSIDGRSSSTEFATVDARATDAGITVSVEGADGLTFRSPPGHSEGEPLRVEVNGEVLQGPAPLSLRRHQDRWTRGAIDRNGRKRPGVSGPIRDVYHEPLLFVVGTQRPNHTAINRQVAEHWAHPPGWDVHYPIVDDVDVTPAQIRDKTLVLIGPPWSNSMLARVASRLPIRFGRSGIRIGSSTHLGEQVGTAFVYPNPEQPDRSLVVIAGLTPLGTWRSRSLPDVLPDYVVYDEQIESARDEWSCGGARVDDGSENGGDPIACSYLEEGFFDMHWALGGT